MNSRAFIPFTKILIIIGVCGVILIFAITLIMQLRIRQIRVIGTDASLSVDESIMPGNLMFFPSSWYEQILLNQHPNLKSVHITKEYPSTLGITLEERTPIAFLQSGSGSFPIDAYGYPTTTTTDTTKLPIISMPTVLMMGLPIQDDSVKLSLAAISSLSNFMPQEITKNDSTSIRVKLKDLDILISHDTDLTTIERTLQTILTGVRMKGTVPTLIDVRFEKPVLMF